MSAFDDVRSIVPRRVWNGITARAVHGERLTLALVELAPGAVAEEHSHDHEQLGLVLRGSLRFRVGDEELEVGPGETWQIPSNTPHRAEAGPDGASVLDLFAPPRSEWEHGEPGEAYNVCSGRDLAISELAERLVGMAMRPMRLRQRIRLPTHRQQQPALRPRTPPPPTRRRYQRTPTTESAPRAAPRQRRSPRLVGGQRPPGGESSAPSDFRHARHNRQARAR